ncbi:hypothetical protein [Hymenobacter rubidus]|uniref:hypothetical protein n=1 Tax=Hymenobacter rubidus TaxID=1441626 RepID=UPI00191EB9EE|nr:hypothetical protein [Hymenobacter rubidus]
MRNLLTAYLPALALLALGGCAGTSALTSSEDDGVYYSSKDRTTAVVAPASAQAPASTNEAANPDYNGGTAGASSGRQGSGSDQYYDNSYTYMQGVPRYGSSTYYGPGLSYYTPYSPYTSLNYGYGWGGGACGFSPYAYGGYAPLYGSFYSPYGYGYSPYYGYGSGVSISFGFGRSYGYSPYGYGYGYSPYGYGYGGYDPYYYNSPFYGGYYGRGGYYGSSYYGYSGYGAGYSNSDQRASRTFGHRSERASDGRYSSGSTGAAGGATTGTSSPTGGGRVRTSGLMAPSTPTGPAPQSGVLANESGRTRGEVLNTSPQTVPTTDPSTYNRPRRMDRADQPQYRTMESGTISGQPQRTEAAPGQDQVVRDDNRGRWRTTDNAPQGASTQPQETSAPQQGRRRDGGFFQNVFSQPSNAGGQAPDQSSRQRYDQSQRTYEQPQQRSYSQPSYSQPSYSAPSSGGGGGGGGGGHSRGPR